MSNLISKQRPDVSEQLPETGSHAEAFFQSLESSVAGFGKRASCSAWTGLLLLAAAGVAARADEEAAVKTDVAVHVAQIQKATVRAYVTGYGHVESAPALPGKAAAGARLSAGMQGLVSETLCAPGQRVEKGAVLVKLDTRAATAQVEKAKQALGAAEVTLERQKKLRAADASSEKNLREAEAQVALSKADLVAAETQLSLHQIAAPLAGTVTKVHVRNGEAVDAGTVLVELADLERLVVAAAIPVAEAGGIKAGDAAQITPEGAARALEGTVMAVSPQVDTANATVTAWVGVPEDASLRSGQFAAVRIVSEERADRLVVPVASVVKDAEAGSVVAVVQDGKAKRQAVKTGLRDGDLIEVAGDGLAEGTTVVTTGAYALPSETQVHIVKP